MFIRDWFLSLVFLFIVWISNFALAAPKKDFFLNHDVFVCEDSVSSIVSTEHQFFTGTSLAFPIMMVSVDHGMDWLIKDLAALSPSRARVLENIYKNISLLVTLKKGIDIQRVSLSSNTILPKGCEVKPLSILTVSLQPASPAFSILINQDLMEKMSFEDQVLSWWGLALDLEQALFEFERSRNQLGYDIEFNLLKTKEFITCWLDLACRPTDAKSFHQFSLMLKLDYWEQSGVLIPSESAKLQPSGLLERAKRIVFFLDPVVNDLFRSVIMLSNQDSLIRIGYEDLVNPLVVFDSKGLPICAAVESLQQKLGPFAGYWTVATSGNSFPFQFPICWDQFGNLTQGYFPVPWGKGFSFSIGNQTLNIQRDPLAGGPDQGTYLVMHPNGAIHWIGHVNGVLKIGSRRVPVVGPVKLRPDQSVECARLKVKAQFENTNGGMFTYNYQPGMPFELLCFNPLGKYEKTISSYEFNRLFVSGLVSEVLSGR